MTPAIFGFLGVIAGGVLTGAIQATVARVDRARAGRVAARLLNLQLEWAATAVQALIDERAWTLTTDWNGIVDSWTEHKLALADSAVPTMDFLRVTVAFTAIKQVAVWFEEETAAIPPSRPSSAFTPLGRERLLSYAVSVEQALRVVFRASFTRRERWRGDDKIRERALARHAPHPGGTPSARA